MQIQCPLVSDLIQNGRCSSINLLCHNNNNNNNNNNNYNMPDLESALFETNTILTFILQSFESK